MPGGSWLAAITVGSSGEPGGRRAALLAHAPLTLGGLDEVVAAAEPLAVARQQDHVDGGVEIGLLDAALELGDEAAA